MIDLIVATITIIACIGAVGMALFSDTPPSTALLWITVAMSLSAQSWIIMRSRK